MRVRGWIWALVLVPWCFGQESAPAAPKLTFRGKPLSVPFHCTNEQVEKLDLECSASAPCAVFLELNGVASASTKLFVTGNLHTSSRTFESVLLASEDEGH